MSLQEKKLPEMNLDFKMEIQALIQLCINDNANIRDIGILKSQSYMKQIVQQNSYKKTLGTYRPRFTTKPQGHYQLYKTQIVCAVSACLGIVIFFFSLCIVLYIWSRYSSTKLVITIFTVMLVIFVPTFLFISYEQSKDKLIKDEQLIKQALQRQVVSKEYKKQWSRQSVKVAAHLQYQFQH